MLSSLSIKLVKKKGIFARQVKHNREKWLRMSKSWGEDCECHEKREQKCGHQSSIASKSAKESLTILIAEDLNLIEFVLYS